MIFLCSVFQYESIGTQNLQNIYRMSMKKINSADKYDLKYYITIQRHICTKITNIYYIIQMLSRDYALLYPHVCMVFQIRICWISNHNIRRPPHKERHLTVVLFLHTVGKYQWRPVHEAVQRQLAINLLVCNRQKKLSTNS